MSNPSKIRTLLGSVRLLGPVMTDDEISDIAKVIIRVTERLENNLNKESEEK